MSNAHVANATQATATVVPVDVAPTPPQLSLYLFIGNAQAAGSAISTDGIAITASEVVAVQASDVVKAKVEANNFIASRVRRKLIKGVEWSFSSIFYLLFVVANM